MSGIVHIKLLENRIWENFVCRSLFLNRCKNSPENENISADSLKATPYEIFDSIFEIYDPEISIVEFFQNFEVSNTFNILLFDKFRKNLITFLKSEVGLREFFQIF